MPFIRSETFHEEKISRSADELSVEYSSRMIPEQNWNEKWEQQFQPVTINNFCGIRAAFHEPMVHVQHEMIITPKMSFGTGHHDTTRLMIEAMSQINFTGKKVLDFGTGTAILSILAEKLGAEYVMAIDHDDWSIKNAEENIKANHCKKIDLQKRDNLDFEAKFDIILVNIDKLVIINNIHFLSQHLQEEGVVLMSGLLSEDFGEVQSLLAVYHFSISYYEQSNNWICFLCRKEVELTTPRGKVESF